MMRLMGETPMIAPLKAEFHGGMGGYSMSLCPYRNYRNAIGYSFYQYMTADCTAKDEVKLLSINGIAPTLENITNGSYPLTETIYAIDTGKGNPHTQELINWCISPQGRELLQKTGYVPLR
jgi:phosphate transport system substrate-binding protein